MAGLKRRAWAIFTTVGGAAMLLSWATQVWTASSGEDAGRVAVRLLVTLMFLLTVGMVLYLMHGERPPEFYERGANRRNNPFTNQKA